MEAYNRLEGISIEAVGNATGHDWADWIALLDKAGAAEWDHKEIVAYLRENHDLSSWWQQTVTVGYEKAKGRRVVGQTADAGFQLGAQKTLSLSPDAAWELLTSDQGLLCWLGDLSSLEVTKGQKYRTEAGLEGEIRVVKPRQRIRLTWRRPDMERHSTLQVTLAPGPAGKTAVRFHHERLPSKMMREEMRSYWKAVLVRLASLGIQD